MNKSTDEVARLRAANAALAGACQEALDHYYRCTHWPRTFDPVIAAKLRAALAVHAAADAGPDAGEGKP